MRPLLVTAMILLTGTAPAAEYNGVFPKAHANATDRIIVQWHREAGPGESRLEKASRASGLSIRSKQSLDTATDVLSLPAKLSGGELSAVLERLRSDPDVAYASPDLRRQTHALTNDPLLSSQWYLLSEQPSATRMEAAWDMTTGHADLVVAVLDTGVRFDHPDLGVAATAGKLLPGYDFVSRVSVANDGDARDADPSDPGDWVDATDRTQPDLDECDITSSSWHGTRVAGLIGALTNNAEGVAGAAFNTRVLPVRVLGKCGGFDSDIIAAMRWAAGLNVTGVPANPAPAHVINLSLGGDGVCTAAYQAAVDEITARGVLVVASAGNDGGPVSTPANCAGVLGVAGIRHAGTKVGFSNLGPELSISAPGGNCVTTGPGQPCLFPIVVATNTGTTVPAASIYTDQIRYNVGTSFSAPQAAATVALMRSVNSQSVACATRDADQTVRNFLSCQCGRDDSYLPCPCRNQRPASHRMQLHDANMRRGHVELGCGRRRRTTSIRCLADERHGGHRIDADPRRQCKHRVEWPHAQLVSMDCGERQRRHTDHRVAFSGKHDIAVSRLERVHVAIDGQR